MISNRVAGFLPSQCGFSFTNWFPPGIPVVEVPTPFGSLGIGSANGGVCGGMVFAAIDFFNFKQPPPQDAAIVFRYLCSRLIDSFNLPFGVLKYYDWQRRPSASHFTGGMRLITGLRALTIEVEWPRIRATIDSGQLAALGLVKASSFLPTEMKRNHQVLGYGYDWNEETGQLTIWIYDPNYPGDDAAAIIFNTHNPNEAGAIVHTCEGETVRGVFLTEYRRPADLPEMGPPEERIAAR